MKVKNTSRFSNELVRKAIKHCRPSGISNFDVMIKNSNVSYAGRSYSKGSGFHCTANPFVVVRIGSEEKFPRKTMNGKGYISSLLLSGEEALINVLAHELRHLWQSKHKKGKVWGSRGKFSERDADAYAINKVRSWRRENEVAV